MAIKHKIVINVSDPQGKTANVLKGANVKLPTRLIKFLFGDFTQALAVPRNGSVLKAMVRSSWRILFRLFQGIFCAMP